MLRRFESLGGLGIAAPSANKFGQVSPTSSKDVQDEIGEYLIDEDLILNGGQSEVGIESTIIDCRDVKPSILRPGAITVAMVNSVAKTHLQDTLDSALRVSGSLESHYAPKAKIIVNKTPRVNQAFMAMSNVKTPDGVFRISSPRTIQEFARNIYAVMRATDKLGFSELVVQVPAGEGIEVALIDRLSKAAKGR